MRTKLKPSPSMIVAIVALVFATTGGAYAAKTLINGNSIRDGTVSAAKLSRAAKQQLEGNRGRRGAKGADGADGAQGPAGPVGPAGAKGDTGAQGAAGAKGEQGPQGAPGERGAAGTNGTNGRDGAPGLPGADGRDGIDGRDGAAGRDGAPGTDGPTGPEGPQGPEGPEGPAGNDGRDGVAALIVDAKPFHPADDRGLPVDTTIADFKGGKIQRSLTLEPGSYRLHASMSVQPPLALDTTGSQLVGQTRCNLVDLAANESIDTFYVTAFQGRAFGEAGYRLGLALGAIVTFAEQTRVEVRCYTVTGPGAADPVNDGGLLSAASLEALPLGDVIEQAS